MNSMLNIFDPSSWLGVSFNWVVIVLCVGLMGVTPKYWLSPSQFSKSKFWGIQVLSDNLKALFSPKMSPGLLICSLAVFCLILSNNFAGLFPYVFSASSHPQFALSIALPIWSGYMLFAFTCQTNYMLSLFLPSGSPTLLAPMLVLIEILSSVIRPLTLCVRLTANMMAGHLLLSLVASGLSASLFSVVVVVGLGLLVTLELSVSIIQSYVFTSLTSLYLKEANTKMIY